MDRMKCGLTSVTFRALDPAEIIRLTAEAGLDGIEWGGDVHVPPADLANAEKIGKMTRDAGLRVLSYGSYFYAAADSAEAGEAVLKAASALGAPNVRIWAGKTDSLKLDDAGFDAVADAVIAFCRAAAKYGITVSTEYHANTATGDIGTTVKLLERVKEPNFYTYFQPDARYTDAENLAALKRIRGRVSNIHVFHWKSWTERFALADGAAVWKEYLDTLAAEPSGKYGHAAIMEFVKDDSVENFRADAAVLKKLIGG